MYRLLGSACLTLQSCKRRHAANVPSTPFYCLLHVSPQAEHAHPQQVASFQGGQARSSLRSIMVSEHAQARQSEINVCRHSAHISWTNCNKPECFTPAAFRFAYLCLKKLRHIRASTDSIQVLQGKSLTYDRMRNPASEIPLFTFFFALAHGQSQLESNIACLQSNKQQATN